MCIRDSSRNGKASRHQLGALTLPSPRAPLSPWKELCTHLAPQFLWLLPRGHIPWWPDSGGQWACVHRFNSTTANKELLTGYNPPGLNMEGEDRNALLYFKNCCLSIWLPTSLSLGADWGPAHWDMDKYWHALNYWEPPWLRPVIWTIASAWETTNSLDRIEQEGPSPAWGHSFKTGRGDYVTLEKHTEYKGKWRNKGIHSKWKKIKTRKKTMKWR